MIYSAWLVWVVPLASVPLIPAASLLDGRLRGWLAVASTGASLGLATFGAMSPGPASTESVAIWFPSMHVSVQVEVDGLSVLVATFVAFVSFLIVVYSLGYMKDEPGQTRYYSLVLLFVGSMLGLVMSGNLVQFYFFWELVGVCSALLIAFWTDRPAARRAGLKAFVVTRLGDAALLVAVILTFVTFGTTTFSNMLSPSSLATVGAGAAFPLGLLMFVGAMGKSAQVPLHGWLPDAMEGPTTVSALIHAATMVNAGVFLMVRMYPLVQLSNSLLSIVLAVGILSALVGGACAFAADDIKRVLAYSTISQLGLMFAAIGLGAYDSGQAATYHMVSQGLFKALAFLAAGSVITALGTRDMSEMGGLAKKMKYTYLGFLLAVLAMSGLPPLVGFWSKDAIFSLAIGSGPAPTALLLVAFALTSLYSFRMLFRVFHGERRSEKDVSEPPRSMLLPTAALSVSVVLAWGVLQYQNLVNLSAFSSPDLATTLPSLAVLAASGTTAYAITLRYRSRAVGLLQRVWALGAMRNALSRGLGFDWLYSSAYGRVLSPLSRGVASLQTERLRTNAGLAVFVVVLVFVLYAAGAL
jgi:NADH-quinone oxidoreductase subunit L